MGNQVVGAQGGVAFGVEAGVAQLGAVADQGGLGLGDRDAQGTCVDLGEHVAAAHRLALAEEHPVEAAVDLRAHGDAVEGADRAQAIEVDRGVLLLCGDHRDGHCPPFPTARTARAAAPLRLRRRRDTAFGLAATGGQAKSQAGGQPQPMAEC